MTDTTNGVYTDALKYVRAGLFVFPVTVTRDASGKKRVQPHGLWRQESSDQPEKVAEWWGEGGKWRAAGIAIDCGRSGLVVVDPDGPEGIANWAALDPPKPLWIVRTAGGGEHWYYRASDDHVIGNDQDGKVAPKVDVRGLGGFVIAPPTSDGIGQWTSTGAPDWSQDAAVPAIVIERMQVRPATSAQPVSRSADEDADAFDDVKNERRFTKAQAIEFVKAEKAKLAATTQGFNGAINNFAMACAHFPWLVDRDLCARLMIKTLGPVTGWTAPDRQDEATINSAYSATEGGKSWVAVQVAETPERPAESDAPADEDTRPDVLPPPSRPYDVARELLGWLPATGGAPHRAWWRDDFYTWTGAHWQTWDSAEVERWLYRMTGDAAYLIPPKKEGGEIERAPWAPTRKKIGDLAHALGVGVLQRVGEDVRCLATASGVVDPVTREEVPHDPGRFNLTSLPFRYDPDARCPQWLAFLDSTLPGDRQAHEFLAEWFGYVLSGRTDRHKIAVLVGPPRCGKGTVARVLEAMVGEGNWAAPTIARLGGTFGLESLIGKSLAVMGDVKWTSKHVIDAVPVMLGISGEDGFSVSRKNRDDWIGKLGARLMLMSNDSPAFTDTSGALAGRMVYVAFQHSFLGREDLGLLDRLLPELSGILNWALDGLQRLNSTGHFTQSSGSLELRGEVERDSAPVKAWQEDRCVLDPSAEFTLDSLLKWYRVWLEDENIPLSPSRSRFSRDLRSAFGDKGVVVERKPNGVGGKHQVVTGLRPIAGGTLPDDSLFGSEVDS